MGNFDVWIWFVVLVPLAALAGWVIGRRGGEHHSDSQVSKLSTTYFRAQFEALTAQAKDLSALAQKIATDTSEPIKSGVAKNFKAFS